MTTMSGYGFSTKVSSDRVPDLKIIRKGGFPVLYSNASTMYTADDDMKQITRTLQERLSAEARSRARRPEPMVLIPVSVSVKPMCDGDYG